VRVTVHSPYHPIILRPFLADADLAVVRTAVATRRDAASFTLRNALLRFDTRDSVLDAVLGDTLALNGSVLSYEGLAATYVTANDLAGIITTQTGAEVLTFDELLQADITYGQMLTGLSQTGFLPIAAIGGLPVGTMSLGDILNVSSAASHVYIGHILPEFRISVLDLVVAMADLAGRSGHHLVNVTAGLNAAPLANPALGLHLVDPGVTVFGLANSLEPLRAEVAQVQVTASGTLANLVRVDLGLQTAVATAELLSLNCAASEPADIVARFRVETAPATLSVHTALLSAINGVSYSDDAAPVPIAGGAQEIAIRFDQIGQPVPVVNPIAVSAVASALSASLTGLKQDLAATKSGLGGLLSPLLQSVLSQLTQKIDLLSSLIASQPTLDSSAQALLDLMGIRVAEAEVIFHGFDCTSALVQ
jgi:uncharacterized membrane protein